MTIYRYNKITLTGLLNMDYGSVLEFLKKVEGNGAEMAESVIAYSKTLSDEAKKHRLNARDAEAKLKRLEEVAGEENLEEKLKNLKEQVESLSKERDTIKANSESSVKELEELKLEKAKLDKEKGLRAIADKTGADFGAFSEIFGDTPMEISGDAVLVQEGDTKLAFTEYLEKQPAWKKAALYAKTGDNSVDQKKQLPNAPPTTPTPQEGTVGTNYITARYSGARFTNK
jgi:hypothetical protein